MKRPLLSNALKFSRFGFANISLALLACQKARYLGSAGWVRAIACKNLAALTLSPSAMSAQLSEASRNKVAKTTLSEVEAIHALREFMKFAKVHGLEPFLLFGTLLGAVREQDFIRGDSDIDFGLLSSSNLATLQARVHEYGFKPGKLRIEMNRPSKLVLKHLNGTILDLKICHAEPDGKTSWFTHCAKLSTERHFPHQFALKEIVFKNTNVFIPDCTVEFLQWQYGNDWRIPDPGYHMLTSGPFHSDEDLCFTRDLGPFAILRVLVEGRIKRGELMALSMGRLFPDDPLWPRLAAALSAVEF